MQESPYPELLLSNTVPLDSQIPVILSAIRAAQGDIRALETDQKIVDERVKERRSALHDFIQTHRSMVSAMRRLPSEILSEIFVHCSTKQDGCKPRLFATVCSRWREVGLSNPRFWCNIYLHEEEIAVQSLLSLLSLQLERSGQVPLSLVFSDPYHDTSILELLLTVSHRWESLDLDLTVDQHEHIRTSPSHFPILKTLTIRIAPSFELGNLSRPLPLLEELTLCWPPCPIPSKFPWTGLIKCTLFHCSSVEVLNVLRASSNIAEISLYKCYYPSDGAHQSSKRTAIISNIRSLKISRCSGAFNHDFLGSIAFPKLQALVIDDIADPHMATQVQITGLLAGSSGPVTHLSLCGLRSSEDDLIALLGVADTVDRLEISWPWDVHSHALMQALTILPGTRRPHLLPRLRTLSITGGLSCRDDDLLTMLESRSPGLERVELYYAGRTFFFDRHLDRLREAGMDIVVLLDGPEDPFAICGAEFEDAG